MVISKIELAKLRAEHNSVSKLKDRTFNRRLKQDYNAELLSKYNDANNTFEGIVQMSTYNYSIESRITDYQKISLPFKVGLKVGDIVYWPRLNKNYLIFADRPTEKNYFLGYMSPANYEIVWYDQYGNKQRQLASFLQTAKETIKTAGSLYDYLDAGMQLLLKANAATEDLSYYNRIWIDNKNWEIVGKSTNTFQGMVAIYLKEVPYNNWKDVKDGLPIGAPSVTTSILTSFDNIQEISQNKSSTLEITTLINGNSTEDEYNITVTNCSYDSSSKKITFSSLGTAIIVIESQKTAISKTLSINVLAASSQNLTYQIEGDSRITTHLEFSYSINQLIDGEKSPINVTWSLNNSLASISDTKDNTCSLKVGNDAGIIILTAKLNDAIVATKEIIIESIY